MYQASSVLQAVILIPTLAGRHCYHPHFTDWLTVAFLSSKPVTGTLCQAGSLGSQEAPPPPATASFIPQVCIEPLLHATLCSGCGQVGPGLFSSTHLLEPLHHFSQEAFRSQRPSWCARGSGPPPPRRLEGCGDSLLSIPLPLEPGTLRRWRLWLLSLCFQGQAQNKHSLNVC